MSNEEFSLKLKEASEIVKSWPIWKQNIIEDSLLPMFEFPREVVSGINGYTLQEYGPSPIVVEDTL